MIRPCDFRSAGSAAVVYILCKINSYDRIGREEILETYKINHAEQIRIKPVLPQLLIRLVNHSNLAENSMIQNKTIQLSSESGQCELYRSLANGRIRQVTGDVFDVVRKLGFEGLKRFGATGESDDVGGRCGGEKIFGYSEADACNVWSVACCTLTLILCIVAHLVKLL